jgi:mono/diheme cytochrome c family protein
LGMLLRRLQRLSAAIAVLAFVDGGCHRAPRAQGLDDEIRSYLGDPRFRRRELEASLVDKSNAYSQLRLLHYASGRQGDWDALPAWNPRVEPVTAAELASPGDVRAKRKLGSAARPIALPTQSAPSLDSLRTVGEEAFFRYPTQLASGTEHVLQSADAAQQYGLWVDPEYGVGGIVRAEMADGSTAFAFTCASCHASRASGSLRVGVANAALDLGRMAADAEGRDSARRKMLLAWGPGRLDVSTAEGTEPIRITDLRPVKWLTHLHQTATVEQRSLTSLAIRIETLIITSHDQVVRPPREISIGLAVYLWSLASSLGPSLAPTPEAKRGRELFDAECRDCHGLDGYAGRPVPVNEVGTDPRVGLSKTRGTGMYRVPSLRGVSTRGPLLHDASLTGLHDLFDPARTGPEYRGGRHGPGAVMGHTFGLDLTVDQRSDLLAFLATL